MSDNNAPKTLNLNGETFQWVANAHQQLGVDSVVYCCFSETIPKDQQTRVFTRKEAFEYAEGKPYLQTTFSDGLRTVTIDEMRVNWLKDGYTGHNNCYDIMSSSMPYHLVVDGIYFSLNPTHYDPFSNRHFYTNQSGNLFQEKWLSKQQALEYLEVMVEHYDFSKTVSYSRKVGYECSTLGDKRFSALLAFLTNYQTIEQAYQCGTLDGKGKGHEPGGLNWKLGKGQLPINGRSKKDLWDDYQGFWNTWCNNHTIWMKELRFHAMNNCYMLRDSYAATPVSQARALAEWLNTNG